MDNIVYREDQVEIMKYRSGSMAVPAVPGAGKTFIVTRLVADLIENELKKGEKILILTYMNSAVNNFRGRIKKLISEKYEVSENESDDNCDEKRKKLRRMLNSYEVMTIHSLATRIIKENPEESMLDEDFRIADDVQRNMILERCIEKYLESEKGKRYFMRFIKQEKRDIENPDNMERKKESWKVGFQELISKSISRLKYNSITPDILYERTSEVGYKGIMIIVEPIYSMYSHELKSMGLLDFDDLLIKAYTIIKNNSEIREKLSKKYRYVFEDECQDSNELQGKIIKLISGEGGNLVRVGDINQSISGTFSESDPEFFRRFINEADVCHRMDMSNRSSKDIIELANYLVESVNERLPERICSDALENMKIRPVPEGMGYKENPKTERYSINTKWYTNRSFNDEIRETVRYIGNIQKKYPDKSIGVLVPYNKDLFLLAKELQKNNIEYENMGGGFENKKKLTTDIADIIDFIASIGRIEKKDLTEKLISIVENIFIEDEDEHIKNDFIENFRNIDPEKLIYEFDALDLDNIDYETSIYHKMKYGIRCIKEIMDFSENRIDRLILEIGDKIAKDNEDAALIEYIAFYIGYRVKENRNITYDDVAFLIRDEKNNIFRHIMEILSNMDGYEPTPGSVTICTYHKSKGLEWDCVFMLRNDSFIFPDNKGCSFQCEKYYLREDYKNPEALIASEIEKLTDGTKRTDFKNSIKEDIIREKIRLLYVAITRAKEMLIISGADFVNDNTKERYLKGMRGVRKQTKSWYFKELEKKIFAERNK